MKKINTSSWRAFTIGTLFEIKKGSRLTKAQMKEGNIRYIGSSALNNGQTAFIGNQDCVHPANLLTVCYNGSIGETFYQDEIFWASDDVNVLYPKFEMSLNIALFIAPLIKKISKRYSYVNKWKLEDMRADEITLPVTDQGDPDWDYIDKYMSEVLRESEEYLDNLGQLSVKKSPVNVKNWKDFIIGDLFEKLTLNIKKENFNKAIDVSEIRSCEFNLPLVNAKHGNNGIMYYGRDEEFESAENTICIVQNGAIATGDVYPEPQRTGVLWDAYLVKPIDKVTSPFILAYLSTVLEKSIKEKFSYDNKCVWDKVSHLTVKLPVTSENKIDWDYMDSYMKNLTQETENALNALQRII